MCTRTKGDALMPLFGKKTTTCPICAAAIEKGGTRNHWNSHVRQIPPGQGDASGQYTWECVCGPAGMKWPTVAGANAGMALHMMQRHGIELYS